MAPPRSGGSMIEFVRKQSSVDTAPLQCFEVGVPVAAQAVGLTAACEKVLGSCHCARVIALIECHDRSIVADNVHALDVGQILDDAGAQFGAVSSFTGSHHYVGSHLYAA